MKAPQNFLLDLADAVKIETNFATRTAMATSLGELSIALKTLMEFPNDDNLRNVQTMWSHARRLLEFAKPMAPPPCSLTDVVELERKVT